MTAFDPKRSFEICNKAMRTTGIPPWAGIACLLLFLVGCGTTVPKPTMFGEEVLLNDHCTDIAGRYFISSTNRPEKGEQSIYFPYLVYRGNYSPNATWFRLERPQTDKLVLSFFDDRRGNALNRSLELNAPKDFTCQAGHIEVPLSDNDFYWIPLGLWQVGTRRTQLTRSTEGHLLVHVTSHTWGFLFFFIPMPFNDDLWYVFKRYTVSEQNG